MPTRHVAPYARGKLGEDGVAQHRVAFASRDEAHLLRTGQDEVLPGAVLAAHDLDLGPTDVGEGEPRVLESGGTTDATQWVALADLGADREVRELVHTALAARKQVGP